MIYQLDHIKGVQAFVIAELKEKHPLSKMKKKAEKYLTFESKESLPDFEDMHAALKIQNIHTKEISVLAKPAWRIETIPAGINPSLAYCLCMAANIEKENIVYDPFCGAGTIPITAALYFTYKKVIASDISGRAIDKTVVNAKAASIREKMVIFQSDIKKVKLQNETIDRIITNLPFGIRVGTHEKNVDIYTVFARKASKLLKKNGRLIFLTQEKRLVGETLAKFDQLKKLDEIKIRQGGLEPHIFIYEKK